MLALGSFCMLEKSSFTFLLDGIFLGIEFWVVPDGKSPVILTFVPLYVMGIFFSSRF